MAGDLSDNELDAFDSKNEQILLDHAGDYLKGNASEEESEEEVLALKHQHYESSDGGENDTSGSENDSNDFHGEEEEEENVAERWGSKKNYYGGDDVSDDDAGNEMAEEALRQQRRHAQELSMGDFVDEELMEDWQKRAAEFDAQEPRVAGIVTETETVDFDALDDAEKLLHLNGCFPEFVPLLTEFTSLNGTFAELQKERSDELAHAKFVALSAYLSLISSYFSIFVDNLSTKKTFSMKGNPVVEAILSTREVWRQVREISSNIRHPSVVDNESMDIDSEQSTDAEIVADIARESVVSSQTDSVDEEEDLELSDLPEEYGSAHGNGVNIDFSTKRTIRQPKLVASGDYTEISAPDLIDKEEKARRRKSLRFYTSKIDQAAKKNAKNEKFDGDADLPYKERLFERQQRFVEARKKGLDKEKAKLGDDLGDEKMAEGVNKTDADYYDSIRLGKAAAREARRTAEKEIKQAARAGKLAEYAEHADECGKRALNFQILKNKGLTPHRKNDNRNARVKKRKRYDQAQKKLRSVRQVYDEKNTGPYQGEKTGIRKNLSRSLKLQ